MDELRRITIRFAGHMEVHYLDCLPEVGDFVSHDGALWTVTRVEIDRVGARIVCDTSWSAVRRLAVASRALDSP